MPIMPLEARQSSVQKILGADCVLKSVLKVKGLFM